MTQTPENNPPPESPADEQFSLEGLLGISDFQEMSTDALVWAKQNLFVWNTALQLGLMIGALIPAVMFAPRLKKLITEQLLVKVPVPFLRKLAGALASIAMPLALYIILFVAITVMQAAGQQVQFMQTGRSLLTAWILVRMVTLVIRSPFWSKVAFYTIWPIMALDAFHVLDDVVSQLSAMKVSIDPEKGVSLSALDVIRAGIIFAALFWVASFLSRFLTGRLNEVDELNPSLKTLFAKILDLAMPLIALLIALQLVGFNLASLAIFGGAIGLGIGLGLQRVISNFAAGVTLLMDKSIKPGDTIEVDETFGWVTAMNTRYVALRTRDGTEHLVPNDIFINNGVVNWSHGDNIIRIHAPFGITYAQKDVRFVQKKAEEVAMTVDRVLQLPKPRCNLVEFGDSSVNFDLRFWINDPQNGVTNVRSDVMMAVWDMLQEHNIEVPFPQRDLHIKSSDVPLYAKSPVPRD